MTEKREIYIEIMADPIPSNSNYEQVALNQQQDMYDDSLGESEEIWLKEASEEESQGKSSFLDPANWSRTFLSEEAAFAKFNSRANNPKYVNARFKCADCYTNFAREEKLQQHVMLNHSEAAGNHVCMYCRRRFQKPCKLRMHLKKHYFQIQCLRCNMTFYSEGLAFQHEEFHRGVVYTCKFCTHQFKHKSTYYQHVRTQHRSTHICPLCGESFGSRAGLNVHKKRLHSTEAPLQIHPEEQIHCRKCNIKFVSVAAYQEHYRHSLMHAEGVDNTYDDQLTETTVLVRCSVCEEVFYTYESVRRHHRAAHPDVPYMRKCTAPPAAAQRVHCDVCGVLIKATSLYTHMNAHTRQRVYKCEECGMEFPYPTSLLRHKVTHTGEKKYPCILCDKRFTQRNSMKLHYRTFHLKEPYPKRNRNRKAPETPKQQNMQML